MPKTFNQCFDDFNQLDLDQYIKYVRYKRSNSIANHDVKYSIAYHYTPSQMGNCY
jgi:hypothetical protein